MALWRLVFIVTLCGVVTISCGGAGDDPTDNPNQGDGGSAISPDSTGGSGGNDVDPVGGSGGDIGAGGVGGFGGDIGGSGGSIEPPPPVETCTSLKSDGAMPTDNPCQLDGRWQLIDQAGHHYQAFITVDVRIAENNIYIAELQSEGDGMLFRRGEFTAEALPFSLETDGYLLELDLDADGRLVQRTIENDGAVGEAFFVPI